MEGAVKSSTDHPPTIHMDGKLIGQGRSRRKAKVRMCPRVNMRCGRKGTNRLLSGNAGRRGVGSHHLRERGGVSADAGLRRRRMTKGHRIAAQPRMRRQSCDPISVAIRSSCASGLLIDAIHSEQDVLHQRQFADAGLDDIHVVITVDTWVTSRLCEVAIAARPQHVRKSRS